MVCLDLHCDCALAITLKLCNARQLRKSTQKLFQKWFFLKRTVKQVSQNRESLQLSHDYFLVAVDYLVLLFLHAAMSNAMVRTALLWRMAFPCSAWTHLLIGQFQVIFWPILSKHSSGWLHDTRDVKSAKCCVEGREKTARGPSTNPW